MTDYQEKVLRKIKDDTWDIKYQNKVIEKEVTGPSKSIILVFSILNFIFLMILLAVNDQLIEKIDKIEKQVKILNVRR